MKNHQFIVHHDLKINEDGTKPLSSQMRFPGHAYVELKNLNLSTDIHTITLL